MKTILRTLIILLLTTQNLWAQEQWVNYRNQDYITCIANEKNLAYIGTTQGVIVKDTNGNILKRYTHNNGLASNFIKEIIIDSQGNKWFGTDKGLTKYDDKVWITFNNSNSGLINNEIIKMAIDSFNNLWILTINGISKFDGKNWTNYSKQNTGIINITLSSLAIDLKGDLWLGSLNHGILKFDGVNWTNFNNQNTGVSISDIRTLAIDKNGDKWIGTYNNGAYKFNDTIWENFNSSNSGLTSNIVTSIGIDKQGYKWFASNYYSSGLSKFDGKNWTNYNTTNSNGLLETNIMCISIDEYGNHWFGTRSYGITIFNNKTWKTYNTASLNNNYVVSIAIDKKGNKWFGTLGNDFTRNGVSKFDDKNWTTYTGYTMFGLYRTRSIAIDKNDNKWFGTDDELIKYNDTTWTSYNSTNSPIKNRVNCIVIDKLNNKWIGLSYGGVYKFDNLNWTNYNSTNSGLPDQEITCIAIDKLGNKWIGTKNGGVYKFDDSNWINYNTSNSQIGDNYIRSIAIDDNNSIWVGTTYGGVSVYNGKTWIVYNTSNSTIINNLITSIAIDKQGNKWIGSAYGVSKFDGSNFITVLKNEINIVAIDSQNNKYFGTFVEGVFILAEDNPFNFSYSKLIRGKIYLDKNKNKIKDLNETYLSNQKISLNNGEKYSYTNQFGEFTIEADTGKYHSIKYMPSGHYQANKDTTFNFYLSSNNVTLLDIGIYAPDTSIYISNIATQNGRCSQESTLWLNYNNLGTTTDNAKLEIQIDKDIVVKSSFPAYDSLKNNKLYYTLNQFSAGTDRQIKLIVQNPDFTRMGDTLIYTSKLIANSKVFNETLKRRITCSYDPNIKEVNPAPIGQENYTLKNQTLKYTIHFQNTGNDTAYNVMIKDSISKKLDYNTLQITGSSHTVSTTLDTLSGLTQFTFYNIMLADSNTNEKASHGFVSYIIKPKANLPEQTLIKNTAYIYFDYNPAVVTNTTFNNLVSSLPNITGLDEKVNNLGATIIPHPLSQTSSIKFNNSQSLATIEIFDLTSQLISTKETTENEFILNRKDFPSSGLYIYQIKTGNEIISGKLMVE